MRERLRRWLNGGHRGTVAIMPDGRFVFGYPPGITDERAHRAGLAIAEWVTSSMSKPLVLPWPVDVRDLRR